MTNPDNYNIELVEGNLKIVDRKIPYTIILEYPDQVFTYAGMEVQVEQPCEKNIVIDGINYIVKNILAKAEVKMLANMIMLLIRSLMYIMSMGMM